MNTTGSMTKAELVEEVSRVSDLTKKHSEVIVDTVFKSIIDALHRGEKIELRGFGSFRLRRREPRKGRNPEDRRQGGRAAEEGAVLQAGQGTEGADQPRAGRAARRLPRHADRRSDLAGICTASSTLAARSWITSGLPGGSPT